MMVIEEITASKTIKLQFYETSSKILTIRNAHIYAIRIRDNTGSWGPTPSSDDGDGSDGT